jgi:choline monooxygenase
MYTDPEILKEERSKIFHRTWQLVGRAEQVQQPGSFFTAEVLGEPVVVVRDLEGQLRAFHNVCRHRAGPVAQGTGCARHFRCLYHGWTYTLDGRLIGTHEVDGMEFFDRSTMPLPSVRLETWGQFLFVNFDPVAPSLLSFLEEIPAMAAGLPVESVRFAERRDYVIACNWKVYVDNYLEGYHIPVAHPGLMKEIDYASYRTETWRYTSRQHAPLKPSRPSESDRTYVPTAAGQEALYFWVFPNLMLNLYPDNLSTNLIIPLGHDKTLTIFEWFFVDPAQQQERVRRAVEFSDQVQQEDIQICEAVQKGLNSISYDRGRYAPKRENGVHHFHSLLLEFLRGDK